MRIWRIYNVFEERFADFKDLKIDFAIFSNPFSVNAEEVPRKYKMELSYSTTVFLKLNLKMLTSKHFVDILDQPIPKWRKWHRGPSSTYVCEYLFSLMNLNKSRFQSHLTDVHLNSTLKVTTAQSLVPDINVCNWQKMLNFFEWQCHE